MKKAFSFLAALAVTITGLVGCKSGNDPKDTALKFLTAIQQMNYTEAKKYATEDSKNMLDALASFQKMMPESAQQKYKNEKFEIKDVQETGDMATVTYTSNMDDSERTLKLKKEGEQWKVAFTKDTLMPDLDEPAIPDSTGAQLPQTDTIR